MHVFTIYYSLLDCSFNYTAVTEKHLEATKTLYVQGTVIIKHNGNGTCVSLYTISYTDDLDGAVNQPPYISFIGPIHIKQFDHRGGNISVSSPQSINSGSS